MTNPVGLADIHKKLDDIARMQDRYGRQRDEACAGSGKTRSAPAAQDTRRRRACLAMDRALWTTEVAVDNGLVARVRMASVAAMAFLRELFRQGRQNRNDIIDLYGFDEKTNMKVNVIADQVEVIAGVQQEHGRRLDSIEGRLGTVEGRLGTVEATQGEHSTKLDEILGILKAP